MPKYRKPSKNRKKAADSGLPMIVFVFIAAGALLGYLGGEIALYIRPHPVHRIVALAGGLLGYLTGQIIYRRYGDIL